jgi:hypothetical protein
VVVERGVKSSNLAEIFAPALSNISFRYGAPGNPFAILSKIYRIFINSMYRDYYSEHYKSNLNYPGNSGTTQ